MTENVDCYHCGSGWIEASRCLDCGQTAEPRRMRTAPRTPATTSEGASGAARGRETATLPEVGA